MSRRARAAPRFLGRSTLSDQRFDETALPGEGGIRCGCPLLHQIGHKIEWRSDWLPFGYGAKRIACAGPEHVRVAFSGVSCVQALPVPHLHVHLSRSVRMLSPDDPLTAFADFNRMEPYSHQPRPCHDPSFRGLIALGRRARSSELPRREISIDRAPTQDHDGAVQGAGQVTTSDSDLIAWPKVRFAVDQGG